MSAAWDSDADSDDDNDDDEKKFGNVHEDDDDPDHTESKDKGVTGKRRSGSDGSDSTASIEDDSKEEKKLGKASGRNKRKSAANSNVEQTSVDVSPNFKKAKVFKVKPIRLGGDVIAPDLSTASATPSSV
jgi:hypothetical protein